MGCSFYEFRSGLFGGDYYCIKKGEAVSSDIYYKYCRNYSYGDCPIYKSSSSSSCFITTIVCNILEKKDDDKVLNNLRFFRENILKKDKEHFEILMDYDNIGPIIASSLENDPNKKIMAQGLYDNILSKVSDHIESKEYDNAINKYEIMVLSLINYYGLKHLYNFDRDNNYDFINFDAKTSGHGRKLKKNHK